jgi:hypothetical protein
MTNFFHFVIALLFALAIITQATPAPHQDLLKRDSFAVSGLKKSTIRSLSVDLLLRLPSQPKLRNLLKTMRRKKKMMTTKKMNQRTLLILPPRRLIFTSALHSTVIMDITEAGEVDIEDGEEVAGEEVVAGVAMDGVDTIEF